MNKVYVVFEGYHYDTFEGNWAGEDTVDSVWNDEHEAKARVKDLANEYVEEQWYEENGLIPGKDYKEKWNPDGTTVTYSASYEKTTFYCKAYELRTKHRYTYEDLPVYYKI